MRIAALIEENKALHQEAAMRTSNDKLRRRYTDGFETGRSINRD